LSPANVADERRIEELFQMTLLRTASAALVAATIAFGAMAPASTPASATESGREIAPVKTLKKGKRSFGLAKMDTKRIRLAKFDSPLKGKKLRRDKYLDIAAAAASFGRAVAHSAYDAFRDERY
jgi:hypothetical protein